MNKFTRRPLLPKLGLKNAFMAFWKHMKPAYLDVCLLRMRIVHGAAGDPEEKPFRQHGQWKKVMEKPSGSTYKTEYLWVLLTLLRRRSEIIYEYYQSIIMVEIFFFGICEMDPIATG